MPFAVGYVEPVVYPERDATTLDSVLEALRGTSKGRLPYPEPFTDHDEVCESKYIGDLRHITCGDDFIDQVSFSDNNYLLDNIDLFAAENPSSFATKTFNCNGGNNLDFNSENSRAFIKNDEQNGGDNLFGLAGSNFINNNNENGLYSGAYIVNDEKKDEVDNRASKNFAKKKGSAWTAYRNAHQTSPVKLDADYEQEEDEENHNDDTAHPLTGSTDPSADDVVDNLMATLQISRSHQAILEFQRAYVARIAAIHTATVTELRHCAVQRQRLLLKQQEDEQQQQQTLETLIQQQTQQSVQQKLNEASSRKTQLLNQLADERQQELIVMRQKSERSSLLVGLKSSYDEFSAALDSVLMEINACQGLAIPEETNEQLNNTLQLSAQVLQQASNDEDSSNTLPQYEPQKLTVDEDLLNHTSGQLTQGISVLQQIRQILDTRKSNEVPVSAATTEEVDSTKVDPNYGHQTGTTTITAAPEEREQTTSEPQSKDLDTSVSGDTLSSIIESTLAPNHPEAESILSAAKLNYDQLTKVHDSFSTISTEFVNNPENVRSENGSNLRSKLSRALAIVNQFNNDNTTGNRQKLHTLINLVTGANVTLSNGEIVSTNPDGASTNTPDGVKNTPDGVKDTPASMFVKEQLSSKLITLSHDKQVLSQAVYASLMLRLYQVDPLMEHLCTYQLYRTCPYLVPYVPVPSDYGTFEEYYKAQGYRYRDNGTREPVDSYLKRMGNAGQLYGRLLSMQLDSSAGSLSAAWQYLCRLLVCPAQSAVTCAVLLGFLTTAGSALSRTYGAQFYKLLSLLQSKFLPALELRTSGAGQADMETLKILLTNYLTKQTPFQQPSEGYRSLL